MNNSVADLVATAGLIGVVAGLSLPLAAGGFGGQAYLWVYSAGALLALVGRAMTRAPQGSTLRVKRLMRLQLWSAVFYCVAAALVWLRMGSARDFVALTLAGAAVQIISSVMLGLAQRRSGNS